MPGGAMSVREEILQSNEAYAASFGEKSALALPPARRFAILTCMDARLDPAKYAGLSEGDAHVIRNAGGRASDDAIRSLVISYKLLGTQEWFVIHHSDCGMEGEFNRSSQHLVMVEVFDGSSTARSRPCDPSEAEIPRASEVPTRSRGGILGRDRQGPVARGSSGCGGRGAGSRGTVVPQRWRDAAIRSNAQTVGPLPVFC
jgi:hypothetical protein